MKLLIFSAPWCGQCRAYHPIAEKFIKEHSEIEITDINAEDDTDAVDKYNVRNLPTTIVIDDSGNEVGRESGILNKEQLKKLTGV